MQLHHAVAVGLRILETLATNAPGAVEPFCESIGRSTVFKPFTGSAWQFIGTQRLAEDSLGHLNCVAYSPVIFQEEVQKVADVRVNIIDGDVFPVIIRSKRGDTPLDWWIDPDREYAPHELPRDVEIALVMLVSRLGLRFGACDLALTNEGEYVFFEVNLGGRWLFAEIMTHDRPGVELGLRQSAAPVGRRLTFPRHHAPSPLDRRRLR